jgi:hypothetical protein
VRKSSGDSGVEAFRVDFLQKLKAFDRCSFDGGPPYSAGVVDEDIEGAETSAGVRRSKSMVNRVRT